MALEKVEAEVRKAVEDQLPRRERLVLDMSVLPAFADFQHTVPPEEVTLPKLVIPDTVAELVKRTEVDRQFAFHFSRLALLWTRRPLDFNLIREAFRTERLGPYTIEFSTRQSAESVIYNLCYETLVVEDLRLELSPAINVFGDVVGKIVGAARQHAAPILMLNRYLVNAMRRLIPVLELGNAFVDAKTEFMEGAFPGFRRTRGVRWLIGLTVGLLVTPVGVLLAVLDP